MIIFAMNIHTGGGKVLLDELIGSQTFGPISHLILDNRYKNDAIPASMSFTRFSNGAIGRIQAQIALYRILKKLDTNENVLFFGSWPPFFKLNAYCIIYLQNCFLLKGVPFYLSTFKERMRNRLERLLIILMAKNYGEIWVQSDWMYSLCTKNFPQKTILKKPFLPTLPQPDHSVEKIYSIITVTSHSKHKNLITFTEALIKLDPLLKKRIRVCIIIEGFNKKPLISSALKNIDLTIKNNITRRELFHAYQESRLAVVTSSFESFCLPLYEALHFDLAVLTLKRPYSAEVNHPNVTYYEENTSQVLTQNLWTLLEKQN